MDIIASHLRQLPFQFSVPRRLADKRSDSQSTATSDKTLPSGSSRSRFHSKSEEVRIDTSSEFHVQMHGILVTQQALVRVPAD